MAVLQYNYNYSFQSTNKKLKKIPTWWLFHHHGQNFTFITGSLHSWVRLKQQRIQKKFESEWYFELHKTLIVNRHIKGFSIYMYKRLLAEIAATHTCTYYTWNLSSMSRSSCCVRCSLFSSSFLSAKSLDT